MNSFEKIITELYSKLLNRHIGTQELDARMQTLPSECDIFDYTVALIDELLHSEEFNGQAGLNSSLYQVKDVDVYYAYKFFLGRLPEGEHIYNTKKNYKNVEQLMRTLVCSEEFKKNKILKDVLSVKRKPFGFDISPRKTGTLSGVIVLSGCQAKTIADLFQAKTGLSSVPYIFIGGKVMRDFIQTEGAAYLEILQSFDLIYTQKKQVYDILKATPGLEHAVRLMPIVEYTAFQPDQTYIINDQNGEHIVGPLGEYQSLIAAAAFYAGIPSDKCAELFTPSTYVKLGYDALANSARVDIMAQEDKTGYPMSELLLKWDQTGKWMRTINHPKKNVLADLVDHALAKEGISPITDVDEYVVDDLASNVDWPLYPGLNGSESRSLDFRFKIPHALAPLANAGLFLNLNDFINATYSSLEPYPIESVSFKQLDRSIDIGKVIAALSVR